MIFLNSGAIIRSIDAIGPVRYGEREGEFYFNVYSGGHVFKEGFGYSGMERANKVRQELIADHFLEGRKNEDAKPEE